ncbi:hypothetical protein [Polyangium spumosum]|uniref:Uncharacterized protein n=1 Tax=Polyangium spumosum TaxID=889282 RepID=A0A6N7Q295_9BACT|nr:hypothetical protein [Polyangium spumosum]MRG96930.1 hypothetical protein [Polyangium spumosum]
MSATVPPSAEAARGRGARLRVAALLVISALGLGVALVSYFRYAAVWLRQPPRLDACAHVARRSLLQEEPVTGTIPHMTLEGSIVYLRPSEDRAVGCLGRMSSSLASAFAAAFAELEPAARARALATAMKDHVPQDPSADREAISAWVIASAAMRALPETPETTAARDEINQRNACRFRLRSTCPTRPPIPIVVWAAGVPSSLGLLFGAGLGVRALVRLVQRRRRRKAA